MSTSTAAKPAFVKAEAFLARSAMDYTATYSHGLRANAPFWKKRLGSYLAVLLNMTNPDSFKPAKALWGVSEGNCEWLQRGSFYLTAAVLHDWLASAKSPERLAEQLSGRQFSDWCDQMWQTFTNGSPGFAQTDQPHHLTLFNKGASFAAMTILGVLQAQLTTEGNESK